MDRFFCVKVEGGFKPWQRRGRQRRLRQRKVFSLRHGRTSPTKFTHRANDRPVAFKVGFLRFITIHSGYQIGRRRVQQSFIDAATELFPQSVNVIGRDPAIHDWRC